MNTLMTKHTNKVIVIDIIWRVRGERREKRKDGDGKEEGEEGREGGREGWGEKI
jgi:hypothetical protein